MKKAWLLLFCFCYFWSCKPDDAPLPVVPPVKEPEVPVFTTEKGAPEGTAASAVIGSGGGALTSSDGRVTLNIPAGALSANTAITIQPITNHMPNGKGLAYRLSPDGQQFSKPAMLTAHYKAEDLEGTSSEALGLAYQDNRGAWLAKPKVAVNTASKTVSKEISTLKDYSLYTDYMLVPIRATLLPGETVELMVKVVDLKHPVGDGNEDLLILGEKLAEASQIKSWKLNGQNGPVSGANGSLSGTGAKMNYKAPDTAPAVNPVAVSVEMDGPKGTKILLISNISIVKKMWRMQVEWLRINRCVPGAIASSTYSCSAEIEFGLDKDSKIAVSKIKNNTEKILKDIVSCNPAVYDVTAKAEGIILTDMQGQLDAKTGQLKFDFIGFLMDFPTYTMYYKEGPTIETDKSIENFQGVNTLTRMPLKHGEVLNLRTSNASTDAGFVFKLSNID
jgi:hypothetical protein